MELQGKPIEGSFKNVFKVEDKVISFLTWDLKCFLVYFPILTGI
jgi:hypothetical protein